MVAGVAGLAFVLARQHDRVAANSGGPYLCPMHVEATSDKPGECPICGMGLVKAGAFMRDSAPSREDTAPEDTIAAAQILSRAAGGLAPNLLGYYPSPLRQHVLRYEVFAPAWLETATSLAVLVYRDQVPALEPAERAGFSPTADPGAEVEVHLGPGPTVAWDRSLSLVHFSMAAAVPGMQRGTVGWVKFAPKPRQMQVIPAGAVLEGAEGPYVLVVSRGEGRATKRPVEIGRIVTGLAAVVSGLDLRELVVSVNAFFWDAERRLQAERRAGGGGML